jgi:hypothetical protein
VPDMAFDNPVSGAAADVAAHGGRPLPCDFKMKRCGFVEHLYLSRAGCGAPMQRRADPVRSEWTRKAAEEDRVWNIVPKGGDGPI